MSDSVSAEGGEARRDFETSAHYPFDLDWMSATGKGVRVGIVDSGVEAAHEGLRGKIKHCWEAKTEGDRVVFVETDVGDSAGHGTACAGIVSSIAKDAELHSIKVLGATGIGDGH
ncbi:MAG: S8 family serine peptidase, partial [Acidobacteriota bacterium]|nr:S8 family serine peptidase [Acidobacteriota bacterium]